MIQNTGKYYVYRHIRLDKNHPFYIGIGTKKDGYYGRSYTTHRDNIIWQRIIIKTKYRVEILLESDNYNFIKNKEKEFIKLYGRIDNKTGILANLTDGGEGSLGWIPSQETKNNISKANKGRIPTKETREKISKANKGKKGKWNHTEETKEKLRKLKLGTTHTQETKNFLSQKFKGRGAEWNEKKVYQYSLDGILLKEWESITKASLNLKIGLTEISACSMGHNYTGGGFQWKYEKFNKIEPFDKKQNSISKSKEVLQFDKDMNFIKEWKGTKDPSEKLNVNRGAIRNCLCGIAKSAGTFIWKYKLS